MASALIIIIIIIEKFNWVIHTKSQKGNWLFYRNLAEIITYLITMGNLIEMIIDFNWFIKESGWHNWGIFKLFLYFEKVQFYIFKKLLTVIIKLKQLLDYNNIY